MSTPAEPGLEVAVQRPRRWDVPFDARMRAVDVEKLLGTEPFASMDAAAFPAALPLESILRNDTRVVRYTDGDVVVREGDYGHSALLILAGTVRVVVDSLPDEAFGKPPEQPPSWWKTLADGFRRTRLPELRDQPGRMANLRPEPGAADAPPHVFLQDIPRVLAGTRTVEMHAGELFGEYSALTRSQRPCTVLAQGEASLLELRWQGLRDLMRYSPALKQTVERLYRQNDLALHLQETPLFQGVPRESLEAVAAAAEFESYGRFDWSADHPVGAKGPELIAAEPVIVEEETPADGVVLVRSGFARQSHRFGSGHRTVEYLGKGRVFGLAESLQSARGGRPWDYRQSLRAIGYVDVLRIRQKVLEQHVFPHLPPRRLADLAKQHRVEYAVDDQGLPDSAGQGGLLEFVVEQRFINGRQAMAIDLDRCTRCDDCVRACASAHEGNPRFLRHGTRHGSHLVTHACMHCVDPVCMIGCPTGAIGREVDTGVVKINDPTCIGCGVCATSCPYDNIRMVEVRDAHGAVAVDEESMLPLLKATKCDLCAGLATGPACVHACPHDALVRIDLGNVGDLGRLGAS